MTTTPLIKLAPGKQGAHLVLLHRGPSAWELFLKKVKHTHPRLGPNCVFRTVECLTSMKPPQTLPLSNQFKKALIMERKLPNKPN